MSTKNLLLRTAIALLLAHLGAVLGILAFHASPGIHLDMEPLGIALDPLLLLGILMESLFYPSVYLSLIISLILSGFCVFKVRWPIWAMSTIAISFSILSFYLSDASEWNGMAIDIY
jgi:hypothetical protein